MAIEAYHDKSPLKVYIRVPAIANLLLESIHDIDGLVFGGSYAQGTWASGHDIDVDILSQSLLPNERNLAICYATIEAFRMWGLSVHIRSFVAAENVLYPDDTYRQYTPFVVRESDEVDRWGLVW